MNKNGYTPVIGLEIHVQLATQSKMFSRCSADWFGKPPNTVLCPVSLGLPGALPVPNMKAIQWAILLGKALGCSTHRISKFDRKHYFYPDLPKGYQISQYDQPFSYEGSYSMKSKASGAEKKIGITRVHLEEDTGKLVHRGEDTLVDFNRAGVPLVEIVTEPDFDNTDDMKQFLEELRVIVRYLGISDADMEKGSMRLEPNISVRKPGQTAMPDYKVEIKNINSFRFAKLAVDYELDRHIELLGKGETPAQETRGYNESKGITVSQRTKETAEDYRYFPDPDIPPFEFTESFIEKIYADMPELPHEKMERYDKMKLNPGDAYILTRNRARAEYFEKVCDILRESEETLEFKGQSLEAHIARLMVNNVIPEDTSPETFADAAADLLKPVETDEGLLEDAVQKILSDNQDIVDQIRNGKETAIMYLVGQVMKEMRGKADPKRVQELLWEKIKG